MGPSGVLRRFGFRIACRPRRRVLRWLDPGQVAAHGAPAGGSDGSIGRGRRVYRDPEDFGPGGKRRKAKGFGITGIAPGGHWEVPLQTQTEPVADRDMKRAEARLPKWMTALAALATLAVLGAGHARAAAGFALGAT